MNASRRGLGRGGPLIRNPLDFFGGIALVVIALVAFWAARDLAGSRGISFGPGTAPRLFAGLLAAAGAAVVVLGLVAGGGGVGRYPVRGPVLVTAAILAFAALIGPLGLALSTFIAILVAAAASPETRWREAVPFAAALTFFCTLLFRYLVGLAVPVWPWS
jgi:putative tricarboxylic transport membrane protein